MLPIVQMGIYPYRQDDWTPDFPEALVLHKFQGTWKKGIHTKQQTYSGEITKPRRQGHLYRRALCIHLYTHLCHVLLQSEGQTDDKL